MKKSILFLLLTGCLFFQTSTAMAAYIYEIKAGDRIKFIERTGPNGGGEFKWVADTADQDTDFDDYTWYSFCVEKNEHVTKDFIYEVQGISGYAKAGGNGGQDETFVLEGGKKLRGDSLSHETAWLYWNFSKGSLGTGDYTYKSSYEQEGYLQNLIWYLEGEITSLTNNDYINNWRQGYTKAKAGGWTNQGQVQVVNLGYFDTNNKWVGIQDQLVIGHMPEPGTMVLLGFGLIGLAGIGRKKLTK